MPGRNPKPTALKRLDGNPGKRPLPEPGQEAEPEKLVALGEPPEMLGEYGCAEWTRVGPILIDLGLLTSADLVTFTSYCMTVQTLIEARKDIAENGMTIEGKYGKVRNPALATFSAATTAIIQFAGQFGLSPAARTRIRLPGDDKTPSLAELLGPDTMEEPEE